MVTSREAGPGTGEFGIAAQPESLLVVGWRQGALAGAGCVVAAEGSGWAVHHETGPSWPMCEWPREASRRLTLGRPVPDASSSPCTGPKTLPTRLVGVGQCGDYYARAQGQADGCGSHLCWSWGRVQTGPGPPQPHSPVGPGRPWVIGAAEPATRVEKCLGASGGPAAAPICPQLP